MIYDVQVPLLFPLISHFPPWYPDAVCLLQDVFSSSCHHAVNASAYRSLTCFANRVPPSSLHLVKHLLYALPLNFPDNDISDNHARTYLSLLVAYLRRIGPMRARALMDINDKQVDMSPGPYQRLIRGMSDCHGVLAAIASSMRDLLGTLGHRWIFRVFIP